MIDPGAKHRRRHGFDGPLMGPAPAGRLACRATSARVHDVADHLRALLNADSPKRRRPGARVVARCAAAWGTVARSAVARSAVVTMACVALVAGCGSDAPAGDGGAEAGEAGRDAETDGPFAPCPDGCPVGWRCCEGEDGFACVDTSVDPQHCGRCGRVCTEAMGEGCIDGRCPCGTTPEGCAGDEGSLCCPPRPEGTVAYCADLETSGRDCGGCNDQCDPAQADRCLSGECVCGMSRSPCSGAPEDRCCIGSVGMAGCVDVTSDRAHCGECGNRCAPGEVCRSSSCTLGDETCSPACPSGRVCCQGVCCSRLACDRELCEPRDGGADAGGELDASMMTLDGGS